MRRRVKKLKKQVSTKVAEKATDLNPLTPKVQEPPSLEDVPRITNENITEHREEVLKGARKYIYPLQHSKHRIVVVTLSIIAAALVGFLVYCSLALYRYHQYNTFVYRITQVVPFPVAKVGGSYVNYENYLFELRHRVHYYQSQQQQTFTPGDQQLKQFEQQSLNDAMNNAYIKKLAQANHVSVSDKEVETRIQEVRNQNRLGSNNKVFADVLRNYFGWSVADYKRSLKEQILADKVVAALDTADMARAQVILGQVKGGNDFGFIARQSSDDPAAKTNSGDYGAAITKDNPNVPPQVVEALFRLQPAQISDIIDAGSTLEIVKVNQKTADTVTAQHISVKLQDISTYINQQKAKQPAHIYVHF